MRTLVIGTGSRLMRDDGIGPRACEAVAGALAGRDAVCLAGETDFACCFDVMRPDDFVIIVDAMAAGGEPGDIAVMPLCEALENLRKPRSVHEFGLLDLLRLYRPSVRGLFIGIEAAEIGPGTELSQPLRRAFPRICGAVLSAALGAGEDLVTRCPECAAEEG